jgi:ATP-dependent Clp protease ATP-binding subunit ClpC
MNALNLTERARKVIWNSREEASRLAHEYVGTEHLLLGLLREEDAVGSTVLRNLSIQADSLRDRIEVLLTPGEPERRTGAHRPHTSGARTALELALAEAHDRRRSLVGSEHLLIGLMREEKGIAAQVLSAADLTLDMVRAETLRLVGIAPGDAQVDADGRAQPGASAGPPAQVRRVRIELQHAGGWLLRHETATIAEAVEFLRSTQ